MSSTTSIWKWALLLLFAMARPASAGYIQVAGPEAKYDAQTDIFSITGSARIGSIAGSNGPGFQTFTAVIDDSGTIHSGVYSLFGVLPSAGIVVPSLLISARVASVSIFATARDDSNPAAGGGIHVAVVFDNVTVDPRLDADPNSGGWGATAFFCCQFNSTVGTSAVSNPAAPWTSSWGGYFAPDYSDISSGRIPEPSALALVGCALLCLMAVRRKQSSAGDSELS